MSESSPGQAATPRDEATFETRASTLDRITAHASTIEGVWTRDLHAGDLVVVWTRNSVYSLAALGDGRFAAAGGWFASADADASTVSVVGCTWGGRAILTGLVAAPGMFVEFDNGVRTTRARQVKVFRGAAGARPH